MNVLYPYAHDEEGRLIDISTIDVEHRYNHRYFCPACGQEMRPRLGKKRAHCFYHFNCEACSSESYVHRVGKELLYQRFYDSECSFLIEFVQEKRCEQWSLCESRKNSSACRISSDLSKFELKDWYDTAELEKNVEIGGVGLFRADLMLYSKTNSKRPPLLVEICFKHRCSEQKIASGVKILELKVSDVSDLPKLLSVYSFKEGATLTDLCYPAVFYNFSYRMVSSQKVIASHSPSSIPCTNEYKFLHSGFSCVAFYRSGKSWKRVALFDSVHDFNALFEIFYDSSKVPFFFDARVFVARKSSYFRNCLLCLNHRKNSFGVYCPLNGSERNGTFVFNKARHCPEYNMHCEKDYYELVPGKDFQFWINPLFFSEFSWIFY